jgi:hypothetical protein
MQCCVVLPLVLALPAFAVLLRHWLFADAELSLWTGPSPWSEDRDEISLEGGGERLLAIDEEIRRRRARLSELQDGGGSGTWTALVAFSSHVRRIVELRQQRQQVLDESRRWRLPVHDPAGIHAADRQDRSRVHVQQGVDSGG